MHEEILMIGVLVLLAVVTVSYIVVSDPEHVDEKEALAVGTESEAERQRQIEKIARNEAQAKEEAAEQLEHITGLE